MGRYFAFDMKLKDFSTLSLAEKQHLLNHTTACLDEKAQEVQINNKIHILPIILILLGMLFILYDLYIVFSYEYFMPSEGHVAGYTFYFYGGVLLGSLILAPTILYMRRHQPLSKIKEQQNALLGITATKGRLRFYFINEHINQLISPHGKALIEDGLRAYRKAQGLQALLWLFVTLLALGGSFGIHFIAYYLDMHMEVTLLTLKLIFLLLYAALFTAIFTFNLFVKRFLAYLKIPTK